MSRSEKQERTPEHHKNGMETLNRIAPDVSLGRFVKIFGFANLYGCTVGEESRIGCFVEIQKNATFGACCKISSHSFICEGVTERRRAHRCRWESRPPPTHFGRKGGAVRVRVSLKSSDRFTQWWPGVERGFLAACTGPLG